MAKLTPSLRVRWIAGRRDDAVVVFSRHRALEEVARRLTPEHLLVFLGDNFFVSPPHRAGPIYDLLEVSSWRNTGIRIHVGKTQLWNRAGTRPPIVCDRLERVAQAVNPNARVWR